MSDRSEFSKHLAGIIPLAGESLDFKMPWHDSLMPIHDNYHAVERAVNTAALAGCNTIWIVQRRDSSPLIRKKIGEWIYDPLTTWIKPQPYWNKREIPIYYVSIRPVDKKRRDSYGWSCLYGAGIASWVSLKLSSWLVPKRFFIVSPYGVVDDKIIKDSRDLLRGDKNVMFSSNEKTFKDNEYLPFTISTSDVKKCRINFKENLFTGDNVNLKYSDIFSPIDTTNYMSVNPSWYHNISSWEGYRKFLSSEHNNECVRPKYMRIHKWYNFVKDE